MKKPAMKGRVGGIVMSQMGSFMWVKSQLSRRPSGMNDKEFTLGFFWDVGKVNA